MSSSTAIPVSSPRAFSTAGLLLKTVLLGSVSALGVAGAIMAARQKQWPTAAIIALATAAMLYFYMGKRRIPAKYLFPGTLLLLIFQLYPVGYTVATSFTNYGTGNVLTKPQAIERIVSSSVTSDEDAPRYAMAVLQNPKGEIRLLLQNDDGDRFVATKESLTPLDPKSAVIEDDIVRSVGEFKRLNLAEASKIGDQVQSFIAKTKQGEVRAESLTSAAVKVQKFRYDSKTDRIVDTIDGTQYAPKDGVYRAPDGTEAFPGYQANIGFRNYSRVFSKQIRGPFLRVLIWNFAFAGLSVLFTLIVGLLLALALNHPRLRGKKFYRQIFIVPYALPAFMMILVWSQGMFNGKYGYVNKILGGATIPWLDNPWLAKSSLLLINTWLGFPYMFLLCTSLLTSIPADLKEAATVDGANGPQIFRRVTFPLLLLGLSPMLISSFAFNFNNINLVLLTTQGGPPIPNSQTIAGQTDLLISYTYKLAFSSGRGNDYGFSTAIAVYIFFIVGAFSIFSLVRTSAFKEIK
jgi:arabinogalactan oligomer / maltooligosaccharide transport system permease protein